MTYKRKSGLLTVMILILVAALAAGALAALSDGFTDWEVSTWFGADNEDDVGLTGEDSSVNYVYACPMDEIVVPASKVTLNEDGIVF